ncbi:MAG: hypothetical protein N5P05_004432 (plasmid) [Chroococcopsis gigantea SAG 12.99]|jgi:hypothetical protein|nr:hypothetical protein [Chlorogloea purpurea SAG 13.99]MDV3002777.1 hypothetical protein [Chroococcopsis gigantea SAG 12.99]
MLDRHRQIPEGLYQRLLEYLQIHSPTDTWSEELLREMEEEAVVIDRPETIYKKKITTTVAKK